MKKELVVAAYDRDLTWLSEVNDDVKKTVYRKGEKTDNENEIYLENNVGRCVHSFFKHIHDNYDNLSDITFFVQDYPFDHWEDVIEVVNNNTWEERAALQFGGYYGFHFNTIKKHGPKGGIMWTMYPNTHHGKGNIIACQSNGVPQIRAGSFAIDLDTYWYKFFECQHPNRYEFMPGGHFGITKEQARKRSKDFYKIIVDMLENDYDSPWNIERLECYMFNEKFK
jgi:hypothetical protein